MAILLAACGVTPGLGRTIDITLTEWSITPFTVKDGETVTFNVTNEGNIIHEFKLTKPEDHHNHDHDSDHISAILAPGETMIFTITIDGYTQAACLLPGHYEAGMYTDIIHN